MTKFIISAFTFIVILIASPSWAQTGPTTIGPAPAKVSEFVCSTQNNKSLCTCSGFKDCMGLKTSGKCKGELVVSKEGDSAECKSHSAGQTAGQDATKVRTPPKTRAGRPTGSTTKLSDTAPKPHEYFCSYTAKGKAQNCGCTDLKDCFKLADSGLCSGEIKEVGKNAGTCKAKN